MTAGFPPHIVDAALTLPSRYEFTAEGVSGVLAALGTTPNEIADRLFELGVRGNPNCDASCPLAEYLTGLYPGGTCSITEEPPDQLVAEVWRSPGDAVQVVLPEPLHTFVRAFDRGEYRELDRIHDEVAA